MSQVILSSCYVCADTPKHPSPASGRLVLGSWWVLTILIVSIYTASLAAMLTVTVQGKNIDCIEDLAYSDLTPFTQLGTSWHTFFNVRIGEEVSFSPLHINTHSNLHLYSFLPVTLILKHTQRLSLSQTHNLIFWFCTFAKLFAPRRNHFKTSAGLFPLVASRLGPKSSR